MSFMITYSIRRTMTINIEQKRHLWKYNVAQTISQYVSKSFKFTESYLHTTIKPLTYHKRHWHYYPVDQTGLTILGINLWGTYAEATMDSEWLQWSSVVTSNERERHWHYYDYL
jgi:hypothetical protein